MIPIPDSIDRVLIVYHIPESTIKPHFNSGENRYFIRVNDSSIAATHYQIRDMFESTRRRYDEFNDFLDRRNLLDENSDDFGLTPNSKLVTTEIFIPESNVAQPLFLLSFIPKFPNNQIILSHKPDFTNWIIQNSKGYEPVPQLAAFPTYEKSFDLYGLGFMSYKDLACINFQNNGYIETCLCDSIFWFKMPRDYPKKLFFIDITYCAGYIISMLSFIKRYYDYIEYEDEITLQLSFRNVLGFSISGFNQSKGKKEWRPFFDEIPINRAHKNFSIIQKITPSNLSSDRIIEIAKDCTEKIMLACNVNDLTLCFIDDTIDIKQYSYIKGI